ncbi:MAG: methylenetetrahydrofolate reductase [bacterium]
MKMKEALTNVKSIKKKVSGSSVILSRKFQTSIRPVPELIEKLKQEFLLSVEIDPPKGTNTERMIDECRELSEYGVNAINVSDLPMAKLRMSALAFAAILKRETRFDIILHITARDRTIIALQSDLLGAYALGIKNILALRGDPPSVGDYPFATGVFDITSSGIVRLASSFNAGYDGLGNPLATPTRFAIGVAFNQNAPSIENEFKRLEMKLKAGAHFIQTQPVFEPDSIEKLVEFARYRDIPVIATTMLISSLSQAEYLANEVPGIKIPARFIQMLSASSDPEHEASVFLVELISKLMQVVNGVCIVFPQNRFDLLKKVLSNL